MPPIRYQSGRSHRVHSRQQQNIHKKVIGYAATAIGAVVASLPWLNKEPMYDSLYTGEMRMQELLAGHDQRFYFAFGMTKEVFLKLKSELQDLTGFNDTRHLTMDEQLGVFLRICRSGNVTRDVQELFQRSPDTTHR